MADEKRKIISTIRNQIKTLQKLKDYIEKNVKQKVLVDRVIVEVNEALKERENYLRNLLKLRIA